jgi:hypothetical protein
MSGDGDLLADTGHLAPLRTTKSTNPLRAVCANVGWNRSENSFKTFHTFVCVGKSAYCIKLPGMDGVFTWRRSGFADDSRARSRVPSIGRRVLRGAQGC